MPPIDDDWVVCLGETRLVSDGHVACPLRSGDPVLMETCAECHLLAWHHDERDIAGASCAVGPGTSPASTSETRAVV
jgi:hypothetical protein